MKLKIKTKDIKIKISIKFEDIKALEMKPNELNVFLNELNDMIKEEKPNGSKV